MKEEMVWVDKWVLRAGEEREGGEQGKRGREGGRSRCFDVIDMRRRDDGFIDRYEEKR
jgi:hypothetical protein